MANGMSEAVNAAMELDPELRNKAIAAVDAKIAELQRYRADLGGSTKSASSKGGKPQAENTSGLTHGAAILKALQGNKKGLTSREIREAAASFGHQFGQSLGTTLDNMRKDDKKKGKKATVVAWDNPDGGKQSLYTTADVKL